MTIKLIVGLGNPGSTYTDTRHNAGAWFLKSLANKYHCVFKVEKKFHAEVSDLKLDEVFSKLLLPLTYMNLSGKSVKAICQFYRINTEEVLIIHDELDLPAGTIKLKKAGGHGGHNGLRDVIQQMGSQDFWRIRIGIGHPGQGNSDLVLNYVLGKPSVADRQLINNAIERGIIEIPIICQGHFHQAMNQLNTNSRT